MVGHFGLFDHLEREDLDRPVDEHVVRKPAGLRVVRGSGACKASPRDECVKTEFGQHGKGLVSGLDVEVAARDEPVARLRHTI